MCQFFQKHRIKWLTLIVILLSLHVGFQVAKLGFASIDDGYRYNFSQWLLYMYGLQDGSPRLSTYQTWYGSLWDLFLAIQTNYVFAWLYDPLWVRIAFTWAWFPVTLYATFMLLRRAHCSQPTAFLAVAFLFAATRFVGHLTQTKDFPVACVFILLPIYIWIVYTESPVRSGTQMFSMRTAFYLVGLSVVPYLLRPPLALHTILVLGLLTLQAIRSVKTSLVQRIAYVVLPLLFALVLIFIFTPAMWKYGPFSWYAWQHSLDLFTHFFIRPTDYFYGVGYKPQDIPWWYIFGWLPLLAHPLTWYAMTLGVVFLCIGTVSSPVKMRIPLSHNIIIQLSLPIWLLLCTVLAWLLVLVAQPALYDGMRHILFLYGLLPVVAAMGYSFLSPKIQYGLAIVLLLIGTHSFLQWGRYSYIYMPPLVSMNAVTDFSGDHRVLCPPRAVRFLREYSTEPTTVMALFSAVYNWYAFGFQPEIRFVEPTTAGRRMGQGIEVVNSKNTALYQRVLGYVDTGSVDVLWKDVLPNGDIACLIVRYK